MFKGELQLAECKSKYEPTIRVVEDDSMSPIDLHLGEPVSQWTLQKTVAATSAVAALQIKESRELFKKPSTNRSCVYMGFDPSEYPEVKYKTDDQLALSP